MDKAYELLRLLDQRDSLDARISKIRDELRSENLLTQREQAHLSTLRSTPLPPTPNRSEVFDLEAVQRLDHVRAVCRGLGMTREVDDDPPRGMYRERWETGNLEVSVRMRVPGDTDKPDFATEQDRQALARAAAAGEDDEQPYTEAQAEAYMEEERG